jgi:hypothetical protein
VSDALFEGYLSSEHSIWRPTAHNTACLLCALWRTFPQLVRWIWGHIKYSE